MAVLAALSDINTARLHARDDNRRRNEVSLEVERIAIYAANR